jgi:hypothetical protein
MASVDRMTPAERASQDEAMSVALAQPHRRGNPDPNCEDAVWRVVTRLRLRDELAFAGLEFGRLGRSYRATIGQGSPGERNGTPMDEDQRAAKDWLIRGRYEAALQALGGCAKACVRLCIDEQLPWHDDEQAIRLGLWRLAVHLGHIKRLSGA